MEFKRKRLKNSKVEDLSVKVKNFEVVGPFKYAWMDVKKEVLSCIINPFIICKIIFCKEKTLFRQILEHIKTKKRR